MCQVASFFGHRTNEVQEVRRGMVRGRYGAILDEVVDHLLRSVQRIIV